jgi:hypothetical protein
MVRRAPRIDAIRYLLSLDALVDVDRQSLAGVPDAFQRLQRHLLRSPGGDREMVEILALVLHHDKQVVLMAVTMALEAGVPTKTHILNLLHRLIDGKPLTTPPITAPQALRLVSEPMANVERYDALRLLSSVVQFSAKVGSPALLVQAGNKK